MDRYASFTFEDRIADIDRRLELDPSDPDFVSPDTARTVIDTMSEARYYSEVTIPSLDPVMGRALMCDVEVEQII